ncbi:cytochrome P450 [Rhizodiscina lignyota]|uniref:Cytochrome P450 n=1 Tax=Rhizodiscina lignyota TaxID=1504668 RepID=A0A9P4IEG6_9PEZI|nr:cytochrome P450 [Rhizodiscina lignyota]
MAILSIIPLISYWLLLPISFLLLRALYRKYLHPLRKVPGPFLASTTNLYRLAIFLRGRQHYEYHELHKKYGPLARLGPNTVILNDPAHFSDYFGWDKSPFWRAFRGRLTDLDHGQIANIKEHAVVKRRVMGGYSMSNIIKSEGKVDSHITELMQQFSARCGTVFDMAPWTQWAAFDIAMDMAFSNPIGFVKAGHDVNGLIDSLHELLTGTGIIALFPKFVTFMQQPWLFPLIAPRPTDKKGPGALYGLAWSQVNKRFDAQDEEKHEDILQWIIEREDREGQRLSKGVLENESVAPVLAGSDTSATVLRAIILYVATNPRVLNKLHEEIDRADAAGLLSTPPKYEEIRQHVPYIAPIMREALRMYTVVGSPMPREVPKGGASINGYFLPGGTEVSICHYAIGRNTAIFGEDADRFRPERWTEEVDPATRRLRETGDVFFSNGTMMCTGRNVATLEIWKIATQLFRQFDIEVVDPVKPWQEKDSLVMLVWDFRVSLNVRR